MAVESAIYTILRIYATLRMNAVLFQSQGDLPSIVPH